jgi:hypothetical protein
MLTNPVIFTILKITYYKGVVIMADLKDSWKDTGKGLGNAFKSLGKSIVRSAATGVKKVDNWANPEEEETQVVDAEKAEEAEK